MRDVDEHVKSSILRIYFSSSLVFIIPIRYLFHLTSLKEIASYFFKG